MSAWNLPSLIDHTVLRPDASKADVLRLCREARDNGFSVIFVPPCYIDEAVEAVADTAIRVGIPIGFPLGDTPPRPRLLKPSKQSLVVHESWTWFSTSVV